MNSQNRNQLDEINFIKLISQYTLNLEDLHVKLLAIGNQCRSKRQSGEAIAQIQIIACKLQLELLKYKELISKIENKIMRKGGIQSLKNYVTSNYNSIIKQAYQVMSMCGNCIKIPTENDFKKLRSFQEELENQWDLINTYKVKNNEFNGYKSKISRNNDNETLQNLTLAELAQAQIQQQFLAIRMVAYKMYQKFNEHSHPSFFSQLQTLKQEQDKLGKQIKLLKQNNMSLLNEQRKLQKQLMEIKRINELVGRRYFIQQSRMETNFTTN